jgi:hypothetical protein
MNSSCNNKAGELLHFLSKNNNTTIYIQYTAKEWIIRSLENQGTLNSTNRFYTFEWMPQGNPSIHPPGRRNPKENLVVGPFWPSIQVIGSYLGIFPSDCHPGSPFSSG